MRVAYWDFLIAAIVIGLLVAAVFYGEPAKGINHDPSCPSWVRNYTDVKCEGAER